MTTTLGTNTGADLLGEDGTPLAVEILGDVASLPPGSSNALSFFALELSVYQPGDGGTLHADTQTLRASDVGYRSRATDAIGLQVYPATMIQAFDIDRHVGLEPGGTSDAAFGSVTLSNLGQRYDSYVQGKNCDSRPIRLLIGTKAYDRTRGVYVDPSYTTLSPFFEGTAQQWKLSEETLEIPLRDATYWADRPLQPNLYGGTGGLDGSVDLAGRPIPMTRGGTLGHPVMNVPLTTVDSVNLIYQWTDGPGTIVRLWEGGADVFSDDGSVPTVLSTADPLALWHASTPAPGHYLTDNLRGLVRMGSQPVKQLTADVTGAFPVAGAITTAASIARYLLTETMGQALSSVDTTTFSSVDTNFPFLAGFFANTETAGLDVVRLLLNSVGGRLITTRSGMLSICVLYTLSAESATVVGRLSIDNVTAVTPQDIPSTLSPPPYRWRVGYNRINQLQTSDFNGAASAFRKALIGTEYQYSTWNSSVVSTAWQRPNDPAPVATALLNATDAFVLATMIGDLFSTLQPKLYAVDMPMTAAAGLDMGDAVLIDWPLADLNSKYGMIVGDQTRSFDATTRLLVLA